MTEAAAQRGARTPAELETEIRSIRTRMDSALDEIEFRLSPGHLSGGAIEVVRDVVQGNPTRLARAIRDNPIPVAMIGLGALWLAWAVSRTPERPDGVGGDSGGRLSDQRVQPLLSRLIAISGDGAAAGHRLTRALGDSVLSARLAPVLVRLEHAVQALETELARYGGRPSGEWPPHPVWSDADGALEGRRGREAALSAFQRGLDGTMAVYRDALRLPLPDEVRVVVGGRFHDLELARNEVGAVREVVG